MTSLIRASLTAQTVRGTVISTVLRTAMLAGVSLLKRELKDLQHDVSTSQRQRGSRREAAARCADVAAREATSVKPADDTQEAVDAQ
jgi:hypothetical protein